MLQKMTPSAFYMGTCPHDSDLLNTLTEYCHKQSITCGTIEAIGAVKKAQFGYYDQHARKYETISIDSHQEILSCTGNISLNEGKPFVHVHITLADDTGTAIGGHLMEGTVIFACEFHIHQFSGPLLEREYDETTGLRLWKNRGSMQA